jgi:hypothetical protein
MNRGYCNTVNPSYLSEKKADTNLYKKNRGVSLARRAKDNGREEDRRIEKRGDGERLLERKKLLWLKPAIFSP